jgi:hypothetical protein
MQSLVINRSNNTPQVSWNVDTQEYAIDGKSFPENTKSFYTPIIQWLENFEPNDQEIWFRFGFDYVSSSSIIALLAVLRTIEKHRVNGANILIMWQYDEGDEDIYKMGVDFERLVSIPFSYQEIKEA